MPFTPPVPPKTKLEFGAMSGRVEFVDQVPNELICSICHKPAEDPQQTRCTCSKLYCLKCIQTSGKYSTCTKNLEAFPDGLSARRLRSLRVKCRNNGAGCLWVNEWAALEDHIKTCPKVQIDCPLHQIWDKISGNSPVPKARGVQKFATFSELNLDEAKQCMQYLKDDTLYFRIVSDVSQLGCVTSPA